MINNIEETGSICDLISKPLVLIDSGRRICYLNKTAEICFDTTMEIADDRIYSEVIHPQDRCGGRIDLINTANQPLYEGDIIVIASRDFNYYLRYKVQEHITASDTYLVLVFEDVTAEEELKQQLKHKQRLAVFGELYGGVVHDINNFLAGAVGCSQLLTADPSASEYQHELSEKIISAVNTAAALSRKLLKFSAPAEAVFEFIDIKKLMTDILQVMRSSIPECIDFTSQFPEQPITLCTDKTALEIIFCRIILNTREFLPDGGKISLSTAVIDNFGLKHEVAGFNLGAGNYLKISIFEVNNKLSSEQLLKILSGYDINATAHPSGGAEADTVENLVRHLQGAVEVTGVGAETALINIYLPLSNECAVEAPEVSELKLLTGMELELLKEDLMVLLVDDNDLVRLCVKELLNTLNCRVIEAENGDQAITIFKENTGVIDLIILDVVMPVKDGRETLVELRQLDQEVEIFMASGYMNQLSQSVFSELGANGYLTKPYKIDDIKNIIVRLNNSSEAGEVENILSGIGELNPDLDYTDDFSSGEFAKIKLMLVESNNSIRELLYDILSGEHFEVTAFNDSAQALQALADGEYFALSVIDMDFAEQQQGKLFALLRNTEDNLPRYIIATSGDDADHVAMRALKLGVDDFILKPFSLTYMKIRLEIAKRYIENEQLKNKIQSLLKESEERLSLAIDGVGIGMWDWKIIEREFYASDKCKTIFGYPEGSNIGVLDHLYAVTIKEDQSVLSKEFSGYLRNPEGIMNIEFRITHPLKGEVWIQAIGKLFDDSKISKPKRLIGIAMDITERKTEESVLREESQKLEELVVQRTAELVDINMRLSREIEAREEAEMKNMEQQLKLLDADKLASLGILVSGIGHEINNPIQFIMFNLPFIKNAWESALPILDKYYEDHPDFQLRGVPYSLAKERLPNMANDVIEGAERISNIVKDLRVYSRKSQMEEFRECDLVQAVLSAKSIFMRFYGRNNSDIALRTPTENILVLMNKTRIEQVVINILQNAFLATEDREERKVGLEISEISTEGMVEIKVTDNGVGVRPEDIKHLTDPFFTTRSGDGGGTGLGLAMCKRIVYDHSGQLIFESELGKGTTVRVILPVVSGDN